MGNKRSYKKEDDIFVGLPVPAGMSAKEVAWAKDLYYKFAKESDKDVDDLWDMCCTIVITNATNLKL